MHKYSAVLAAAEPFRKQCIVDLKRALGIKYIILSLMGMNIMDPTSSARLLLLSLFKYYYSIIIFIYKYIIIIRSNIKVDTICNRYEIKLDEIVRSYGIIIIIIIINHNYIIINIALSGIPLADFNYLSDQITRNTKLKQRVLLQVSIIISSITISIIIVIIVIIIILGIFLQNSSRT